MSNEKLELAGINEKKTVIMERYENIWRTRT